MSLDDILTKLAHRLDGRTITRDEADLLRSTLDTPAWWTDALLRHPVVGVCLDLSEEVDESGFGVSLKWLTPEQAVDEATNVYPGSVASKLGLIPFGSCLFGSGDYYYLDRGRPGGDEARIVRIFHELSEAEIRDRDGVDLVAPSIELLFTRATFPTWAS